MGHESYSNIDHNNFRNYKEILSGSVIILGGPHTTHEYQKLSTLSNRYYCFRRGEIRNNRRAKPSSIKGMFLKIKKFRNYKTAKERIKDLDILLFLHTIC